MHRSACDGWVSLSFASMLSYFLSFEIWQAENFLARFELDAESSAICDLVVTKAIRNIDCKTGESAQPVIS